MLRLHVEMYLKNKQVLINKAIEAANNGINHRDFLVGCALLAYNGKKYGIFAGANLMPIKGGIKVCAEQGAISSAVANGFKSIIAIIVAGQPQVDGESGVSSPTLHPCGDCRELLQALPGISNDTIVYTITRDDTVAEQHFFKNILHKHKS